MLDPITRGEIARRNGALSKGPKTEAGKSRSAKNAITHGLAAAKTVVLRNENPDAWREVFAAYTDLYRPADAIECELVQDIAFCRWRLCRFRDVDTALWDLQMEDQSEDFAARYKTSDEAARLAFAFRFDPNLHLASRYEGRLRRSYERAVRNLEHHRATAPAREKGQNEPS